MATRVKSRLSGWKLRRLAPRALAVLERHKASDAVLLAFEPTLLSAAHRYMAVYEDERVDAPGRQASSRRHLSLVAKLYDRTQAWMVLLERDLPQFRRADYASTVKLPEEVIGAARGVLAAAGRPAEAGAPLPYAEVLAAELADLLAQTERQTSGVEGSLVDQQARADELRTAAIELGRQLRLFRRAVKRVLGASHRDYLRLRIRAKREADVEDDADDLLEDVPAGDARAPLPQTSVFPRFSGRHLD